MLFQVKPFRKLIDLKVINVLSKKILLKLLYLNILQCCTLVNKDIKTHVLFHQ